MGACLAVDEATVKSRHIDRQNKKDYNAERRVVKLLLLGTGGSGKSTIVKQMKILHGTDSSSQSGTGAGTPGLTQADRVAAVDTCRSNAVDSMGVLLSACSRLGYSLGSGLEDARVRVIKATESGCGGGVYTSQLAQDIAALWGDVSLQKVVIRGNEFQLCDSAPYFLTHATRLATPDYLPTDEDILRARSVTSGIVVVSFQTKELKFELVDVGGQRSERKKWIQVFDNVTSVLFIIPLSDYNQVLYEDNTTNRMRESEKLFGEILNCIFFKRTPFIVFFNKVDLFQQKLQIDSLKNYFPEFNGFQDFQDSLSFIKRRFLSKNKFPDRDIYNFETTATDTNLVKNIFAAISEIILNKMLSDAGFE
eukprot:GFUD01040858.1.p1 GENE.GFUD01040858.1~~GFUD01040858.1.p1  ORF type:complete len:365 (-),score=98.47 GFUD01040858.1:158-1252(-)